MTVALLDSSSVVWRANGNWRTNVMRKSVCSRLKVSLEGMLDSVTQHTSETVNLTV